MVGLGAAEASEPVLDDTCVVSALNRTAPVDADGVWVLPNVPANLGQVRVRATCIADGVTRTGQSDFFSVPADGIIQVADVVFDDPQPVAASLSLTAPATTLTSAGQTVQLTATASYPDGSTAGVSAAAAGTSYTISNPAIATVDGDGLVTALASGTVLVSAANEGALGLITVRVVLSGDSDGDGLPDDFELANGLDPGEPADAFADPDGDGLGNLDEFQRGLDLFDPDTDGDGLLDGEEVTEQGTDPLLFDTDGDLVSDGLEVVAGSDPLDPLSVDLAPILESFTIEPPSFALTFNTVVGEASRRLRATGVLVDGTVLDVTGPPYGTDYASSDLTIASFGLEAGRVFAGADGTATVTASNGAFSASSEITVHTFSPTAFSFIRIPGFANSVAVQGDYAYVAAGKRRLYVVDVRNPSAPFIAGSIDAPFGPPRTANAVDVEGNYAFVADGQWDVRRNTNLRVIDVSEPTNPVFVTKLTVWGFVVDVVIAGGRAYLAAGSRGIHIVDVSDPQNPVRLGGVETDFARRLDVSGDLVVVAEGSFGVKVIDASDPANPFVVGSTHTRPGSRSAAADVVVRDRQVWVADGSGFRLGGLRAIEVSAPVTPVVVGSTSDAFGLSGVALERDFVLASDIFFANAVPIFNVGGPAPVFSAVLDFSGPPSFRDDEGTDVAVEGGLVFMTGASGPGDRRSPGDLGDTGLHIGRYLDPESIENLPPTVALADPPDGASVLERRLVTVRAEAVDDVRVAMVEFLVDGEAAGRDFSPPFEHTFRAPAGPTSLTLGAVARDRAGNEGTAEEIVLQVVPDAAPTADFMSPRPGAAATEGTEISVAVQATDDVAVASVELMADGVSQQVLTEPPYRFDVAVPVGPLSFTLSAAVTDDAGQTVFAGPLPVTIEDDLPPFAAIVSPVDGSAAVAGSTLQVVAGAADDRGVARVRFRLDGELVGEGLEQPYEVEIVVPVSAAELTLTAEAIDTLGQAGPSAAVRVEIAPDPLTTVFGRLVVAGGQPFTGAAVETGALSGVSGPDGFFSIPDLYRHSESDRSRGLRLMGFASWSQRRCRGGCMPCLPLNRRRRSI